MTNSPEGPKPPLDASLIASAPIKVGGQAQGLPQNFHTLWKIVGEVSDRVGALEAEGERLEGEITSAREKAKMMRPYANKVFNFVVCYCAVVGVIIIAKGTHNLDLPETLLGIIAGSTAVSVIGLIGIVVSGLFGKASDG